MRYFRRFRVYSTMPIVLISLSLAGCGPRTGTVSGGVVFEGKPLESGSVIIYCADKQIVRGVIVDGHYSIPNVPYGSAIATLQSPANVPSGLKLRQALPPVIDGPVTARIDRAEPLVLIPQRYCLPEESGLAFTVDAKNVTYEIDLKP